MQSTLREMEWLRMPLLIWIAVSAVAAVAGPFGTSDAMGLGGRALYWGGVVGASIVLSIGASRVAQRFGRFGSLAVWVAFLLFLSAAIHLANSLLFDVWRDIGSWFVLAGNITLVTVAVHLVIWALDSKAPTQDADAPADLFLRRLPIELRAPLVRIEAQDHYLNVVTAKGSTLILMRLGDAIAELGGMGFQVHRSHWIAVSGVEKHRRDKGRDVLVMSDGGEVPVSRSYRATAQEAGLF